MTSSQTSANKRQPRDHARALTIAFAVLLFAFVLLRGLNLAAAQRPLNGWDEYQHLAAMTWLLDHGTMPMQADTLPPKDFAWLQTQRHPDAAAQQLAGISGMKNYREEVWDRAAPPDATRKQTNLGAFVLPEQRPPRTTTAPPEIYQAQQSPLFYQVMIAIKRGFAITTNPTWLDAGRILNVTLGAGTVVLWFLLLLRILPGGAGRSLAFGVPLLIGSTPLFMQNHARVANDALAIFFGTAALYVYHRLRRGETSSVLSLPYILTVGGVGLLVGLAVTAKTLALILVPTFIVALFITACWRRERWGICLGVPAIFLVGYLLAAGSFHYHTFAKHGSLSGTLASKRQAKPGEGLLAIVTAIPTLTKRRGRRLVREALFYGVIDTGSWNELPQGRAKWIYKRIVLPLSAGLLLLAFIVPTARRRLFALLSKCGTLILALAMMWLALFYYGLQTKVTLGVNCMLPWYGILTWPVLLLLIVMGAAALSRPLGVFFTLTTATVFAASYYPGNYQRMIFDQTGETFSRGLSIIRAEHTLLDLPVASLLWGEYALLALLAGVFVYATLWAEPSAPDLTA